MKGDQCLKTGLAVASRKQDQQLALGGERRPRDPALERFEIEPGRPQRGRGSRDSRVLRAFPGALEQSSASRLLSRYLGDTELAMSQENVEIVRYVLEH